MLSHLPHPLLEHLLEVSLSFDLGPLATTDKFFNRVVVTFCSQRLLHKHKLRVDRNLISWLYELETLHSRFFRMLEESKEVLDKVRITQNEPEFSPLDEVPPVSLIKRAVDRNETRLVIHLDNLFNLLKKTVKLDVPLKAKFARIEDRIHFHLARGDYVSPPKDEIGPILGTNLPAISLDAFMTPLRISNIMKGAILGGHRRLAEESINFIRGKYINCGYVLSRALALASWKNDQYIIDRLRRFDVNNTPIIVQWAACGGQAELMWKYLNHDLSLFGYAIVGAAQGFRFDLLRQLMQHKRFKPEDHPNIIVDLSLGIHYRKHLLGLLPELLPHLKHLQVENRGRLLDLAVERDDVKAFRTLLREMKTPELGFYLTDLLAKQASEAFVEVMMNRSESWHTEDRDIVAALNHGRDDLLECLLKKKKSDEPCWLNPPLSACLIKGFPSDLFVAYDPSSDATLSYFDVNPETLLRNPELINQLIEKYNDRVNNWLLGLAVRCGDQMYIEWCVGRHAKLDLESGRKIVHGNLWGGLFTWRIAHKKHHPETYSDLLRGIEMIRRKYDPYHA